MTLGSTLGTALLVTLTRPMTWALALAAFLLRGGIVWFLVPILVLPSPVGLANALGPTIMSFVFGGLSLGLIALMLSGAAAVVLWIVVGGLAAASIEVELIRLVAGDEELDASRVAAPPTGRTLRVAAVRLIAHVPLLIAVAVATTRIIAVTYAELTLPSSSTTPIAWRVLQAVPETVVLIAVAWLAGEVVGALATRRVALADPSIIRALAGGIADAVRHPLRVAGLFAGPSLVLLLVLIPAAAASTVSWTALRSALAEAADPLVVGAALGAFLFLWIGGLVLAGAVCAWRQAVWTVAAAVHGRGTFGGSPTGRPGDWNSVETSATL